MRCEVAGCERQVWARQLCSMHYQRWRNSGNPGAVAPSLVSLSPEERFWASIQQDDDSGCWLWQGSTKGSDGYAVLRVGRRKTRAHRYAYELLVGPIPEGLHIDHLCQTPACVNPGHMEPVTQAENALRGEGGPALNARKTHCVRGHPLEGSDALLVPDPKLGRRICRHCVRINRMASYYRKRAKNVVTVTAKP